MPRVPRSLLLVPLAGALLATAAHADVVAGWTIEAPVPSGTSGPEYSYGAAEQGANIAGSDLNGVHANPDTFWISPPGNGSQYSFGNNRWTIGDYFQVRPRPSATRTSRSPSTSAATPTAPSSSIC